MVKAFGSHIGLGINTLVLMPCDVQNRHVAQKGASSHFGSLHFLRFGI